MRALAGLWIAVSPWLFHYADDRLALAGSVLTGLVVAGLAGVRYFRPKGSPGQGWLHLAVGLWVIALPWTFGFAGNVVAAWDKVVVGLILAVTGLGSVVTARRRHRPL